jgi:hypothetical protein
VPTEVGCDEELDEAVPAVKVGKTITGVNPLVMEAGFFLNVSNLSYVSTESQRGIYPVTSQYSLSYPALNSQYTVSST